MLRVTSNGPTDLPHGDRASSGVAGHAAAMLRAARRHADLSQRDLAEMAGTSRRTVERAEGSDASAITVGTLPRLLAAAAGCRLAAVTTEGTLLGVVEAEVLRDRGGRHYPAHLDVRRPGRMGEWWGDWPYSVWLIP